MRLGIISDTHGLLRPEAARALSGVDLIVHAGDVGKREVLTQLKTIAPVFAVRGNVDTEACAYFGNAWTDLLFSYLLVRGKLDTTDKEILHGLTLNWKAVLLVMIPLFYVPVRIFLEEAYEILGVKRQPQSAVSAETAPAPPTTDMEGK